ncbi:CBS domain-containing protein [Actinopolymorpha singaporensis]|uniref:CBS domain-containing protein n=2 Tax=Actinopolymorpha singaporensis TaxID=117157 RepID=A0A1H1PJT5_9ACTN|nr:CBS domain-containing protein [Actinopolymorpha singaporensis]
MHAIVGDRIIVQAEVTDRPNRLGTVREVLGTKGAEHYRVDWDDGHESLLYPGPDTRVLPRQRAGEEPTARPAEAPARPVRPDDPVERIMGAPVANVDAHDSLRVTAVSLADAAVGALVVMDQGSPLGMISERDVVHALAADADPEEVQAHNLVGATTVWASPADSISRVAALMRDSEVRHIPLRQEETVVGVASIRDVLRVLLDYAGETHRFG